jgi:hypothetical protein
LRAVDRAVLRLDRASLVSPECFNVVLVIGTSWHQRGAIRRTATAPLRQHSRRGRSPGQSARARTVTLQSAPDASLFCEMISADHPRHQANRTKRSNPHNILEKLQVRRRGEVAARLRVDSAFAVRPSGGACSAPRSDETSSPHLA